MRSTALSTPAALFPVFLCCFWAVYTVFLWSDNAGQDKSQELLSNFLNPTNPLLTDPACLDRCITSHFHCISTEWEQMMCVRLFRWNSWDNTFLWTRITVFLSSCAGKHVASCCEKYLIWIRDLQMESNQDLRGRCWVEDFNDRVFRGYK